MSFIFFWFNPPKEPTKAEIILAVKAYLTLMAVIKIKGAIFCQVKIKIHWNQFKNILTWGNQKWKGANPAFIKSALINKSSKFSKFKVSCVIKLRLTPKIKRIDAIAWDKKYLIEASVILAFNSTSIRGIMLIKLISKPTHLVNHELADTAIDVPIIKIKINKIW